MSSDLNHLLNDLADEMTDTNYTALRGRVEVTSRRIGRRHATAVAVSSAAAVVAIAGAAYGLAPKGTNRPAPATTGGVSPSATPSASATGTSPTRSPNVAVPNSVPGTLVYLSVVAGQPITMTTVTDGVSHQTKFGTATASDALVTPVPSPDTTRIATIESSDPGNLKPGALVVVSPGGSRHTVATGVSWDGGNYPVWTPDGQHIIATVGNQSSIIDVATGHVVPAQPAEGNEDYLTWSANGHWRAYGLGSDIVVTAPDGSGAVRRSISTFPECQSVTGCPNSVQAVSDDGRYVALGRRNTDPSHVNEAHIVLDMRTGTTVPLPALPGGMVNKVYFRPDGSMVVRIIFAKSPYKIVVARPDRSTIATFRDPQEKPQTPDGPHLVAYHP